MAEEPPNAPELKEIGRQIKAWRGAAKLTQNELAQAIGESRRNIVRWENGQHEAGAAAFLRIMSATGVRFEVPPEQQLPRATNEELQAIRVELADGLSHAQREIGASSRRLLRALEQEPEQQPAPSKSSRRRPEEVGAAVDELAKEIRAGFAELRGVLEEALVPEQPASASRQPRRRRAGGSR